MSAFAVEYAASPFLKPNEIDEDGFHPDWWNWRCEVLLTRNRHAITNRRVLDLTSHMGAMTYGCLQLGAKHVTGVEGWPYRVQTANEYLRLLGCRSEDYSFINADVFNYLPTVERGAFDTILCFGFLYHTMRQVEFFREISRIAPTYLLIDTIVQSELTATAASAGILSRRLLGQIKTKIKREFATAGLSPISTFTGQLPDRGQPRGMPCLAFRYDRNRIEEKSIGPVGLVAHPTRSFIEVFLQQHGFDFHPLAWNVKDIKNCDRAAHLGVYVRGERVSYFARRAPPRDRLSVSG